MKKEETIGVRVTKETRDVLEVLAKQHGSTLSQYSNKLLEEKLEEVFYEKDSDNEKRKD